MTKLQPKDELFKIMYETKDGRWTFATKDFDTYEDAEIMSKGMLLNNYICKYELSNTARANKPKKTRRVRKTRTPK